MDSRDKRECASDVKESGIFEQPPFKKTKIIVDDMVPKRLYQQGKKIAVINELISEMLENPSLQEMEEEGTEGPFNREKMNYWFSPTCSLVVAGIEPERIKFLKELEKIDLTS